MKRTISMMAAALAIATLASAQGQLDLSNPDDSVKALRKIQVSLEDGTPTLFWFQGKIYSRVPGERDKLLFTYQAMNVRAAQTLTDPDKGYGYKMVSREMLLYMDPQTGEVLRSWTNPWTDEEVEVVHVLNDPVNTRFPIFARGPRGPYHFDATFQEGTGFFSIEVPLFYTNPLAGEYQGYVGGTYQAIEMFNFVFREDELLEDNDEAKDVMISWGRMSQWLPWMKMGARPGQLMYTGIGKKVSGFDALPQALRDEIRNHHPEYETPPALDDDRPNETSWTYFKKHVDKKRAAEKQQ